MRGYANNWRWRPAGSYTDRQNQNFIFPFGPIACTKCIYTLQTWIGVIRAVFNFFLVDSCHIYLYAYVIKQNSNKSPGI
jgi:hypothetical protein